MIRQHTILLITACMVAVCACAPIAFPAPEGRRPAVPPGTGLETFTILTYNVWHGLNTGEFWVTRSETPEENDARLQFQVDQMSVARPDLILLQEVNPLPARADRYVQALADRGLDYDVVHQVDACGVRLRGDAALVPGLNNGVAILARKKLGLMKLLGLKLSGDLGNCDSVSGVQLEELRYALIGDIMIPEIEQRFLIVSTHLHSGIEAGTAFLQDLDHLYRAGQLPRYPDFRWEIQRSQLRRIGELDTLARELRKLQRQGPYAGFAIGGDFNFEPDFPEYREAMMLRLEDTHSFTASDGNLYSADPVQNALIDQGHEPKIPKSLKHVIEEAPQATAEQIQRAYRLEASRPRRIDYLFMQGFLPGYCLRQELFGTETNVEGLPASDHYGVLTIFSRADKSCPKGEAPRKTL